MSILIRNRGKSTRMREFILQKTPQGKLEKRNLRSKARDFFTGAGLVTAGILCVFQGGQVRSRGKRSAWMREFLFESLPQASSRAGIYKAGREIFSQLWAWLAQEYFVYFKPAKCADAEKDPLRFTNSQPRVCLYKKGAGAIIRPRMDSRFAMSDDSLWLPTAIKAHAFAYADRTLRPLARRRARTLRPLEVAILLRKPWTLDLWRRLG